MFASDDSVCATRVPCEVVEVFPETVGAWLPVQVAESSKALVVVVVVVVVAMGAMGLAAAIAGRRRAHYPIDKDDRRTVEKDPLPVDTRALRPLLPSDAKWEYEVPLCCLRRLHGRRGAHGWRAMGNETSCRLTAEWNYRDSRECRVGPPSASDLCLVSFQDMDLRFPPCDSRTPIQVVYPGGVIDRPYMKSQMDERTRSELAYRLELKRRLGLF